MKPDTIFHERYKIINSLGEGGMANVYLAKDLILDRLVAVKVLRVDLRDDHDTIRRFKREALATTELVHPNIVSVYDVGEVDGLQYMVMEYVSGHDLKTYIMKQFPIPYQRIIDIMTQILSAVEVAHSHNIIHRDLKPQNILIDEDGNAKITDFGIAVALADHSLTQTNTLLGSVHYLSPEQARGSMATKQSDIYSLGIILYEMLTGKVPFEGETAVSIALKHFQSEVPSVREFDSSIPQALENVVLQATSKVPRDRFQTAEEMSIALRSSLSKADEPKWYPEQLVGDETKVLPVLDDQSIKALSPNEKSESIPAKKKKMSRKKKWAIWAAVIALILIVGGIAMASSSPKEVRLPDVSGMTISEAKATLADKNLKLGKIGHAPSKTVSSGDIIRSTPKKDEIIRENTTVDVVVSKGKPKVTIGNYVGSDIDDVETSLKKDGFTVVKKMKHSDSYAKNVIMSQSIPDGSRVVPKGTVITLTISSGSKDIKVIDLGNYSEDAVNEYAQKIGVNISIKQEYSDNVAEGHVISQSPAAGSTIVKGGKLTVVISKGSDEVTVNKTVNVPFSSDSDSKTENLIEVYISDKNHNIGDVSESKMISNDTDFNLSFVLDSGKSGQYKIVRDGKTIAESNSVRK